VLRTLAAVGILLVAAPAAAAGGLRPPVRLTAGASEQLLGELAPDGRHVYFLSDRDSTLEIHVQDLTRGGPRRVFPQDADASSPRVSPDGQRLLFISYKRDATGDACIWELAEETRRCLTGPDTSEAEAFWFPDGVSVGVVSREGLHGDLSLRRLRLSGGKVVSEPVLRRNLASPAISPDGRWLCYVPVERGSSTVGVSFSRRADRRLEVVRLGAPYEPVTLEVDLPGVTASPAFSTNGAWLYFTQYLNDTNFDGSIDGDDHGVLFRVPFSHEDPGRAAATIPEQLTSAGRDCRYPAPAADRLIMTCDSGGSLDVYSLPLEGSVPPEWDAEELAGQVEASRDHWEKLLLLGRMASRKGTADVLRRMALLHTELREYESAAFYARQVRRWAAKDPARAGWADVWLELAAHRAEERGLIQGRLSRRFVADQRQRLERLEALERRGPASVALAARVARAEVLDVLGEEGAALEALSTLELAGVEDPFVLRLVGDHPPRLLATLGEGERVLALLAALADHPALPPLQRLRFAGRFVSSLLRGLPWEGRAGRLAAWLPRVEPGSELALLLELESWLSRVGRAPEEELRKGVFELYRRTPDRDRRKALVAATVARAADADQAYLVYEFANSWVSWVKRADAERRYAERLYRQVVLDRAYVERAEDQVGDARGHFYAVARQTGSLEAHVGFVEARYAEGKDDLQQVYAKQYRKTPDDPVHLFVRAYLLVRRLPGEEGARARALDEAAGLLREAAEALPRHAEVCLLRGHVAHQQYLRSEDPDAALEALGHYLLALDLARERPRWRASVLQGLGVLQADVGNHRLAVDVLRRREALPVLDPERALALELDRARSLFHSGRSEEAAGRLDGALARVEEVETLARYRPLVLDRAALYHYDAGSLSRAVALQEALELQIAGTDEPPESRARRLLLWGAALLGAGRPKEAEVRLEEARPLLPADLSTIRAGLAAESALAQGDLEGATAALRERRDLLLERWEEEDRDETAKDLARVHFRLAEAAWRAGYRGRTREMLEGGLYWAGRYSERTGTELSDEELHLLRSCAELHLYGRVPLAELGFDLRARLSEAYETLCERRNPRRTAERWLLGVYLTMLEVG